MTQYTPEECCYLYWKFYHKQTKGINIKRFTSYDKQKKDINKWVIFEKLAILANENNINLSEYVPMVCKKYDKFFHPKVLINPGNLSLWKNRHVDTGRIIEYEKVANKFIESVRFIVRFCVKNNLNTMQDYIGATLKSHTLGMHITTGRLSKYFLCMLPNNTLDSICKVIEPDIANQVYNMVTKNKDALCSNTLMSLKAMKNIELRSVIELVNSNIQKNMKK